MIVNDNNLKEAKSISYVYDFAQLMQVSWLIAQVPFIMKRQQTVSYLCETLEQFQYSLWR